MRWHFKIIFDIILVVGLFFGCLFVVLWMIPIFADYLESQGMIIQTATDRLAFLALVVSMGGMALTVAWNFWHFRRTSHAYQPVASVEFRNMPPYKYDYDETIIAITNKGGNNLHPEKLHIVQGWDKQRVDIATSEYETFIAPEETIEITIRINAPVNAGTHKVFFHMSCSESGYSWRKMKTFTNPTLESLAGGNF